MTDTRKVFEALIEQAKADFARIESEWGFGLSYEQGLARGDEDALTIKAADDALAALGTPPEPPIDEWEYAVTRDTHPGVALYPLYDEKSAARFIENPPLGIVRYEGGTFLALRRRKAGPWESFTPEETQKDVNQ